MDYDDEQRLIYLKRSLFRMELEDEQEEKFVTLRKQVGQDLNEYHDWKKTAAKEKNFELAKWVSKELIKPLESFQKAMKIAQFILIDGSGNMPDYPKELWNDLVRIDAYLDT